MCIELSIIYTNLLSTILHLVAQIFDAFWNTKQQQKNWKPNQRTRQEKNNI